MLSPEHLPCAAACTLGRLPLSTRSASRSPGIEPHGNTVLQPAHFTVQTVDAGLGEVLVYIEDPEGHTEEVCRASGREGSAWAWSQTPQANRDGLESSGHRSSLLCWGLGEASPRGLPGPGGSGGAAAPVTPNLFPSHRPRWFPTTTRTAPTRSPTFLRSLGCTRYLPAPLSIPVTCLALAEWTPLSAHTSPCPAHAAALLSPSLALLCPSTPSQNCSL